MIFGIEVRKRICEKEREFLNYVNLITEIDMLRDHEKDSEIKSVLSDISEALESLKEVKAEILKNETHKFEKEFVEDILKNERFYKDFNNIN